MQRNQARGGGNKSHYNDWSSQHRDMTPPRGSGLQSHHQQQQGHPHPLAVGSSSIALLATPTMPSQGQPPRMMGGGNHSLLGAMPVYGSLLQGMQPMQQPRPQSQKGGGAAGGIASSSSSTSSQWVGNVQTVGGGGGGGQKKPILPGHSSAVPVVNTGLMQAPPPPQLNIWDLASGAKTLAEIAPPIRSQGIAGAAMFVLGHVENFLVSRVEAGKKEMIQEKLKTLVSVFVLQQTVDSVGPRGEGSPVAPQGQEVSLSAAEELQLLLALQKKMEEQKDMGLRYALFDAVFGRIGQASGEEFELVCKLVSLCISLESKGVLMAACIWMAEHSLSSLGVASYLFREFCELLPDASGPLAKLVDHTPHLAYQLTSAITSLYPFHILSSHHPEVNPNNLQPPTTTLDIISGWVESSPEFLYCASKHSDSIRSKLPLLYSPFTKTDSHSISLLLPITGVMQWCILAPLAGPSTTPGRPTEDGAATKREQNLHLVDHLTGPTSRMGLKPMSPTVEGSVYQEKLARLHAEVLSALLSVGHTSTSPVTFSCLSSDDVAVLVATLLAFNQKQGQVEDSKKNTNNKTAAAAAGGRVGYKTGGIKLERKESGVFGGTAASGGCLEQSVERFAQFLQISLSTEVLQLKPEDLTSIASTLPKNRLLEMVIAHCSKQLKVSKQSNHKGWPDESSTTPH